jgi:hypothetical protein
MVEKNKFRGRSLNEKQDFEMIMWVCKEKVLYPEYCICRLEMECMKNIVHGFMLSLANLSSIILGFIIYFIIKAPNQIMIQGPIAIVLSCMIFSTYVYIYSKTKIGKNNYMSTKSCFMIYIYSLVCTPIIFIPAHFITQGYLTSLENIIYMWLFQAITNIIVIYISSLVLKSSFDSKVSI